MAPTKTDDLKVQRARLRQLGDRRVAQEHRKDEIAEQIRSEVRFARDSGISMSEVARLLHIDRSTLYRVYVDEA